LQVVLDLTMPHSLRKAFRLWVFTRAREGRSQRPRPACSVVRLVALTIPAIIGPVTQSTISTVTFWSRTPAHLYVRSTPRRSQLKRSVRPLKKRATRRNPNYEKARVLFLQCRRRTAASITLGAEKFVGGAVGPNYDTAPAHEIGRQRRPSRARSWSASFGPSLPAS